MARVRSAARDLADELSLRGWGGGVLYGFGEPGKAETLFKEELEVEEFFPEGGVEPDPEWDGAEPTLPTGRRVSIQSRLDYVVADEVALRASVRKRLDAWEVENWIDDDVLIENPVLVLSIMDGMGNHKYQDYGLVSAGLQSVVKCIPKSLEEMGWVDSGDAYPTSHP